jgi:hypothetical protein
MMEVDRRTCSEERQCYYYHQANGNDVPHESPPR